MAEFMPEPGVFVGVCQVSVKLWRVYENGVSNARGSGVRVAMTSPKRLRLEKSLRLSLCASNNEAKYEGLIAGFRAV